jgi:hypothetical protein
LIKDDEDDDNYCGNNNNNNNNSAQTVLKKGRLVTRKMYLTSTEEMQDLGTGNTLQVRTYGQGKVKIHDISKCFKSKMQKTIHQGGRHFQNVHLNFCLNRVTYG